MKKFVRFSAILVVIASFGLATAQNQPDQGGQNQRRQRQERGNRQRGGMPGFQMRGGPSSEFMLVFRKDVQADLNLSADQAVKLKDLQEKRRGVRQGDGQNRRPDGNRQGQPGGQNQGQQGQQRPDREAMRARMQGQMEEFRKELTAILTPEQAARLKEINLQLMGDRAIFSEDVQRQVEMTSAQKVQLQDLMTKFRQASQTVRQRVQDGDLTPEQGRELSQKNGKALAAEAFKILTAEQQAKLKTLAGKPFKADPQQEQRRGGGGGGGRGGR